MGCNMGIIEEESWKTKMEVAAMSFESWDQEIHEMDQVHVMKLENTSAWVEFQA